MEPYYMVDQTVAGPCWPHSPGRQRGAPAGSGEGWTRGPDEPGPAWALSDPRRSPDSV